MGKVSKCRRLSSTLDETLRHRARIDTELFHARDQSGPLETHTGSGTISSAHAASSFLQDAQEFIALIGIGHCGNSLLGRTVAQIRHRNF